MNTTDSLKNLAQEIKEEFERYNSLRVELSDLDRHIEKLRNDIDYEVVFNKDLKNNEQRDAEKKAKYYENKNLLEVIRERDEKYRQSKDLEANIQYYRNLLSIGMKRLEEEKEVE